MTSPDSLDVTTNRVTSSTVLRCITCAQALCAFEANNSTMVGTPPAPLPRPASGAPSSSRGGKAAVPLRGCVLSCVDLTAERDFLDRFDPAGAYIIGDCRLPQGLTEDQLVAKGAIVIRPRLSTEEGFDPIRQGLYTVEELKAVDAKMYAFVRRRDHTQLDRLCEYIHDGLVLDALNKEIERRSIVGIMGGHSMTRNSEIYREVARLCHQLAKLGFTIITGGGPGAMESGNLGAFMADWPESDLDSALKALSDAGDESTEAADALLAKYGRPGGGKLSLGVPTWLYGQEPTNRFASLQAKFVSNAVREDILVTICNCGIIFTEGSAGTRTEIAQYAVPNCYASEKDGDTSKPMIFFKNVWVENSVYQSLCAVAQREDEAKSKLDGYSKRIYVLSDPAEVVKVIQHFQKVRSAVPEPSPAPVVSDVMTLEQQEESAKQIAAYAAVDYWVTKDGMTVGIGGGSTIKYAIARISDICKLNNWRIVCVPGSLQTRKLLLDHHLLVSDLKTTPYVDVVIDGADRCDLYLNLIKGRGGCLLQEKILAFSTGAYVVIGHWEKDCETLSSGITGPFPVPLEASPLAVERIIRSLQEHYGPIKTELRTIPPSADTLPDHRVPFATDNANYIIDVTFTEEHLHNPKKLEASLHLIPGVLEVGLFTSNVTMAFFGKKNYLPGERPFYTRRRTEVGLNPNVSPSQQHSAIEDVLNQVKAISATNGKPVVEIDLDMCGLTPYERIIFGLRKAGADWEIPEFSTDPMLYTGGILPGLSLGAWKSFLVEISFITKNYPDLPWIPTNEEARWKSKPEPGSSVWSSFYSAFWKNDLMGHDIPTSGLREFIKKVEYNGGVIVFLSSRWKDTHLAPTQVVLHQIVMGKTPTLLFGNADPFTTTDWKNKVEKQQLIREKNGTPVAVFDSDADSLSQINKACGGKLICVQVALPGYSCNRNISKAARKISTFDYSEEAPHSVGTVLKQPIPQLPALLPVEPSRQPEHRIRIATFNCENLFLRFKFKTAMPHNRRDGGWSMNDTNLSIFDEVEKRLTANCIREINADVIALEEVEDLVLLDMYNREYLSKMYPHRILIQGNDQRFINVGVLSKYPFQNVRTHRAETNSAGSPLFSRDCLEVDVSVEDKVLHLLVNHFKSMLGGRAETRNTRRDQVNRVVQIIESAYGSNVEGNVVVVGDFNDYCAGPTDNESGVTPLVHHPRLENVLARVPPTEAWTHYFKKGREYHQLDYLLPSRALSQSPANRGTLPVAFRKGVTIYASRYDGPRYSTQPRQEASDHCPLYMDLVLL
ncbi:ribose 5-phosphate isomerase, type A [Pelomyxa schiedti]|nr:ribose 5-phosphate isomerase, type A [Pelomyxa schiedti]